MPSASRCPSQRSLLALAAAAAVVGGAPLVAQDSVSKTNGLPGDAVPPWADNTATNGSEQCNQYVLDLVPFGTSWGTQFGIGPLVKSSKVSSTFFTGVLGAQAMSRAQLSNMPIPGTFGFWSQTAGRGVNNDPAINDPAFPISAGVNGNQFAAAFTEFGTTDAGVPFGAIVTALVRYDPINSTRLYVDRVLSAISGCDTGAELATFGFGAVDADGFTIFRADGFGVVGATCAAASLTPLSGDNVYMVGAAMRDCDIMNVISLEYPFGLFDATATNWLLQQAQSTHNTPTIGNIGVPIMMGTNFNNEYVRGSTFATLAQGTGHLASTVTGHRGGMSTIEKNHASVASTHGIAAVLGQDQGSNTTVMNVFGIDASANVTGSIGLIPPGTITDPVTLVTNIPGTNEFDHYHSQVAFRGGNGQVGMNIDPQGRLVVAAVMDHPSDSGPNWNQHFIPVAFVDDNGNAQWTIAAYNSSSAGVVGKELLDGPGGNAIGRLTTLDRVTGGTPFGPSMTSPMVDSGGNIWFVSAIEIFGATSTFSTGLVRAVLDPTTLGYELELVFQVRDVFSGANSGIDYQIDFIGIADSNSISSNTAWSQNICADGHNGQDHNAVANRDPLHLGGVVVHATISYDRNENGVFGETEDQDYDTLLFVGATTDCQMDLGGTGPGSSILTFCGTGLKTGESSQLTLTDATPLAPAALVISTPGLPDLPIAGGTIVSGTGLLSSILVATGPTGSVSFPINGRGTPLNLALQYVSLDPSLPQGLSFSNAVLARFGQ